MSAKTDSKKLAIGAVMMAVFIAGLVGIFTPLFDGKNGLEYLDNLYNSISKGSAYYLPRLQEEAKAFAGQDVKLTLKLSDARMADRAVKVIGQAGAKATVAGFDAAVEGDLGAIMAACLEDADKLFANDGDALEQRHGMSGRLVVHTWWNILVAMEKDLNRQKMFKAAKFVGTANKKGVECAYNYYRIEPQNIGDQWLVVVLSLLFYVLYTVWYGFAVLFMFEGAGFRLSH